MCSEPKKQKNKLKPKKSFKSSGYNKNWQNNRNEQKKEIYCILCVNVLCFDNNKMRQNHEDSHELNGNDNERIAVFFLWSALLQVELTSVFFFFWFS